MMRIARWRGRVPRTSHFGGMAPTALGWGHPIPISGAPLWLRPCNLWN